MRDDKVEFLASLLNHSNMLIWGSGKVIIIICILLKSYILINCMHHC